MELHISDPLVAFAFKNEDTGQKFLMLMADGNKATFIEQLEGDGPGQRHFREMPREEAAVLLAEIKAQVEARARLTNGG